MSPSRQRSLLLLGLTFNITGVLLLLSGFNIVPFVVDMWWFDAQGYGLYFWQRFFYKLIIFVEVGLFFFIIFFLNFLFASRYLGSERPVAPPLSATQKRLRRLFRGQINSLWFYIPFSIALSILVALPLFRHWEAFMLYLVAPATGIQEIDYGKDISYYLFSFPIYQLLVESLFTAFLLLLLGLALLYWLKKRLFFQRGAPFPRGVKWHLSILALIVFLLGVWGLVLQRYALLYSEAHEPIFYGPGFIEMRIILPFIWVAIFSLMGMAFSFVFFIQKKRGIRSLIIFSLFFAFSLGIQHSQFLYGMIEKYIIKPNEFFLERFFIGSSIQATLQAYDLLHVEVRDFEIEEIPIGLFSDRIRRIPLGIFDDKVKNILRNIPVWDKVLVDKVYRQLERLRTYYTFPIINVDRYRVGEDKQQVFLGARELNFRELPSSARQWVNEHLLYTHGYGAAMTTATEPLSWFMRGVPLKSDYGFNVRQPGIYYGLGFYTYAIAPNENREFHYPEREVNVMTSYEGKGGVPLSRFVRRLIFALFFKDAEIILSAQVKAESRILFRRNIVERIQTLTPFLNLDSSPYLVVTSKGLFWIQDAYTMSSWYPNSETTTLGSEEVNYLRNSVKIVVDAYDGTVDYYLFDSRDPIIQAYRRIYPGLFKTKAQMPAEIRSHIRYPIDLFEIQMGIYAKYHQRNLRIFYQQEDRWDFIEQEIDERRVRVEPDYLILDLIEENSLDFLLFLPMVTKGIDNLRAIAVAGSDEPNYGKLVVHSFPKGRLVYGPSQVKALIRQDPIISAWFTLWNLSVSEIALGKMRVWPIGKSLLYLQPVYLLSKGPLQIPQLQRIILSEGQFVVMGATIEEAYVRLKERIETAERGQ